jgi:hypothetical protein
LSFPRTTEAYRPFPKWLPTHRDPNHSSEP